MALVVSAERKQWPTPRDGEHEAVCVDVIDMGEQDTPWGSKRKVRFVWELDETRDDGKPFLVSQYYTLSLLEKSQLRKDLRKWRGQDLSRAEIRSFDLESMIKMPCRLVIELNDKGEIIYANVAGILPSKNPIKESGHYKRRELDETPQKKEGGAAVSSSRFEREKALPPSPVADEEDDIPF